jgi:hypothetical protein
MESYTPAALAIPHEQLLPSLAQYYFNEQMVRALRRELDFVGLEFRAHQICFAQNFFQREAIQTLSINRLSREFGCPPSRVKEALANGLEPPKVRGCHFAIDEDSEVGILEWIETQAEKCDPVTRTDIRHYC